MLVLSAGLHTLAFPPWRLWPLAWVALVPLFAALRDLPIRSAVFAGCLWGSLAIWGIGGWVAPAIAFYYQQPLWFGVLFCLVGCIILWGSHYALFAAIGTAISTRTSGRTRSLLLAIGWVACEFLRGRLVTGEPWMLLGYAVADRPLVAQAADLGGVYLLSFVVAFANTTVAEMVHGGRHGNPFRPLLAPTAVIVAVLAYGAYRLARPPDAGAPVEVALVQGNNAVHTQWRREFYGEGLERYIGLSLSAKRAAVLVWPESAVTFFLAEEPAYRARVGRVLGALDAELIVGGPYRDGTDGRAPRIFNSAFLVDSTGAIRDRYDKARLLAFAEFFPLRFLEFLRRQFDQVRNLDPGDGRTLLTTRAGRAAVVICFEAIFPELVRERMQRGAELLVNLSNDTWLRGAGPEQHLQMVVLRAIENRVWVVRATTTGISALIDPLGRVQARTEASREATLAGAVAPLRVWTLYKEVGDLFAWTCLLVTAGALLVLTHPRAANA